MKTQKIAGLIFNNYFQKHVEVYSPLLEGIIVSVVYQWSNLSREIKQTSIMMKPNTTRATGKKELIAYLHELCC